MANIHITRTHQLGLENARAALERFADSLREELQAECEWSEGKLLFKRAGASGTIEAAADRVDVDVELDMALSMMKGAIEERINRKLDDVLG